MERCQVKKGIFVLKECGAMASVKCDDCGIYICGKHGKQNGPKIQCIECYTKSLEEQNKNKRFHSRRNDYDIDSNYMLWYYGTRSHFYRHSNYNAFDENDYNSFTDESDVEFGDDSDTGDFFDS